MVCGLKDGFLERGIAVGSWRADDMRPANSEESMTSASRGGRSSEKAWRSSELGNHIHGGLDRREREWFE